MTDASNETNESNDGKEAPETPKKPQRPRGMRRFLRWIGALVLVVVLIVVLALGTVLLALTTDRGTRYAWDAATSLLGGRLTGKLDGGAIASGLQLRDVRWKDGKGTDIAVDSVSGRWALTRDPLRFTIDYLHIGTIDARIAPSNEPSRKTELPRDLRLPIQLAVRDLSVAKLRLHQGATTTEFSGLLFNGRSDGQHHEAAVQRLTTPFGSVTAAAKLDGGARPFPLSGDATYAGRVNDEAVQVGARLSGSLEDLIADVDASGMKLAGRAHVEATPFADVPLKLAIVTADHINPQAISAGAPAADLAVRAEVKPVQGAKKFVVSGPVSIVNAKPGSIDKKLLPLIDARANVRLDASAQSVMDLNVRLLKDASIAGGGAISAGHGRFDLKVAKLDLNAIEPSVRPTDFAGPVGVVLAGDTQTVTVDLNDPKAAIRAQAKIRLDAKQTTLDDVKLMVGKGRVEASGVLKKDVNSSYDLKAKFVDFNPLLLQQQLIAQKPAAKKTATPPRPIEARVNGTLAASGVLAPTLTTKATFRLGDSMYDNLPLTGEGTVQIAGTRVLPSTAKLSVAGNDAELNGSFGAPGDRLRFRIDAPQLERLGFGIAGTVKADGDLTGSMAHPNVAANYQADGVVFGANRLGHAEGRADIRDGANGALVFTLKARDASTSGIEVATLDANLNGTRMQHTLGVTATGKVQGQPVNLTLGANGKFTDAADGPHWDGAITKLTNKGTPSVNLESPLSVSYGPQRIVLGATRLVAEGTSLNLKSFALEGGRIQSAGTLTNLSVPRLLEVRRQMTGEESSIRTDLIFDGNWDFSLGATATGYAQIKRRGGDVTIDGTRGVAALGISDIVARADFTSGNRLNATLHAQASRIGAIDANVHTTLVPRDGMLTVADEAPLSGAIDANVPELRTTGGLLGANYLLGGKLGLKLTIAGIVAKPSLSGSLTGDNISATVVDQGVQLKDGIIRIALSENLVDFRQVEFHGASGVLRATGKVRLDQQEPDLTASIIADKLELFASPDRELMLSGSASIANAGLQGGMAINGKFTVDHALFDLPESSAPALGDDVVIVRPDGTVKGENTKQQAVAATEKPVGPFTPRANIDINLGQRFRFKGAGADLGLAGTITATSAPNMPLRAIGNVRVTPGSTYTAFGRKLGIENGFFTFNGPVANPGINILAMRRNQEIEAGVQVTGTVQSPVAKLISEPNVPDNEKLSWLLFGHGTDQGNNIGQQSAMTSALALLGSRGGAKIAQTVGLDEFTVGSSEVGLTDPQVVLLSKAINERLVLGYEQGLQSAQNAVKATLALSRFWSTTVYGGTYQGIDLSYTRRFNSWARLLSMASAPSGPAVQPSAASGASGVSAPFGASSAVESDSSGD
ncbi:MULTISPECIES: translocation/assembly module TamB domain-containing protein [unclassified Caballeronia]|uniref:translocation/assembly module TamB domain-containing protein n=1 Tax=unclassified Caballeronia TaxID=2646786 RepID=UPI002858FA7B|nr:MULTISPECIES: translocation/assembly module TamB domain-containing protein [unclassified Caballeronia]MDR5736417.1 translocation/assembly module TamB domain-containing protein [Caballeronia sp. LZ016]MDR5811106.1 translocation/assembly module TamB domain-containing protein [Caballeronia sp. LZ019]